MAAMSYEEALAEVGFLPTWELRELVGFLRMYPRTNHARETRLLGAAKVVLRHRSPQEG